MNSKKSCTACNGRGVTRDTAPEIKPPTKATPFFKTEKQGSGCPLCLGIGFLDVQDRAKIH